MTCLSPFGLSRPLAAVQAQQSTPRLDDAAVDRSVRGLNLVDMVLRNRMGESIDPFHQPNGTIGPRIGGRPHHMGWTRNNKGVRPAPSSEPPRAFGPWEVGAQIAPTNALWRARRSNAGIKRRMGWRKSKLRAAVPLSAPSAGRGRRSPIPLCQLPEGVAKFLPPRQATQPKPPRHLDQALAQRRRRACFSPRSTDPSRSTDQARPCLFNACNRPGPCWSDGGCRLRPNESGGGRHPMSNPSPD